MNYYDFIPNFTFVIVEKSGVIQSAFIESIELAENITKGVRVIISAITLV